MQDDPDTILVLTDKPHLNKTSTKAASTAVDKRHPKTAVEKYSRQAGLKQPPSTSPFPRLIRATRRMLKTLETQTPVSMEPGSLHCFNADYHRSCAILRPLQDEGGNMGQVAQEYNQAMEEPDAINSNSCSHNLSQE